MRTGYRWLDLKTMKERDDLIMRLVEQGIYHRDIGRQVGLSKGGVTTVVQRRRKEKGIVGVAHKGGAMKGFTLLELLVIVAILSILAAVVIPVITRLSAG